MSETETRYSGVKVADLHVALGDATQLSKQRPGLKKSALLIESLRYEGQSKLTAADHKIYQLLLTLAREQGGGQREYETEVGKLASFVSETHLPRIRASLERLARTSASYDFVDGEQVRRWGVLKLVGFEGVEDLRSGTSKLVFWFDPPVQRELIEAKSYAVLDLYEVSLLRCRYAPRLYELLALPAGYDEGYRRPVRFTPEDLAAKLGYAPKKFNAAVFRRDVLDPAMADIGEYISSFEARFTEKRAGRGQGGGKVVEIEFNVTPSSRKTDGMQAARVSNHVYSSAKASQEAGDLDKPSSIAVGRAVTAHGESDLVLWSRWNDAIQKSRTDPNTDLGGMEGAFLLSVLSRDGADAAFLMWADAIFGKKRPAPSFLSEPEAPAPAPQAELTHRKAPVREDFKTVSDFSNAVDEFLGRTPPPPDTRFPRQKADDAVRDFAKDIVDMLDGYEEGTNRSIRLPEDSWMMEWSWPKSMSVPENGWNRMASPSVSPEVSKAWTVIEKALRVLARQPVTAEVNRTRRGSLRDIAGAIAEWNLDRAARVAGEIVSKAPKSATMPPVHRPAFLTRSEVA